MDTAISPPASGEWDGKPSAEAAGMEVGKQNNNGMTAYLSESMGESKDAPSGQITFKSQPTSCRLPASGFLLLETPQW
jgi:hypothetical protein